MTHTDILYQLVSSLGLYKLGDGGVLDAELAAYHAAFTVLRTEMDQIMDAAFIETAPLSRLSQWERLLDIPLRRGVSDDSRRSLIFANMRITPDSITPAGTLASLLGAGLRCQVVEDVPGRRLDIHVLELIGSFDTIYDAIYSASKKLPCHLECIFFIGGLTWDNLHQKFTTWQAFDDLAQTWEDFDTAAS